MTLLIDNLNPLRPLMRTPADRARNILLGFSFALSLVLALGLRSNAIQPFDCISGSCSSSNLLAFIFTFLIIMSLYVRWSLNSARDGHTNNYWLSVFVDIDERDLWHRLEQERIESNDIDRISDAWAQLEAGIVDDETE